ncbi:MAG: GGDEF domain-containing protein [Bacillus subtilis]|nr:GGDEF domain-containing protein [Bacillus subtilis]
MIALRTADADGVICDPAKCSVPVESDDDLGDTARAFNGLIGTPRGIVSGGGRPERFNQEIASQLDLDEHRLVLARFARPPQPLRRRRAHRRAWRRARRRRLAVAALAGQASGQPRPLARDQDRRRGAHRLPRRHRPRRRALDVPSPRDPDPADPVQETAARRPGARRIDALSASRGRCRSSRSWRGFRSPSRTPSPTSSLQELAATDPLTSIYNRRFGTLRLDEEHSRAVRMNVPLGVMMCDIDHFKSVNDTYGHVVGDKVLIAVAQIVKRALREGDIALRYGGEEFIGVLPGASLQDTRLVAERIRRAVAESVINFMDQEIKVTISIGVAAMPETIVETAAQLVQAADKAMYRAKENGRNRVE